MKFRKIVLVLLLILAAVAAFWGYRSHQQKLAYAARYVCLAGVQYEKNATELDLSGKPLADLEDLKAFTGLKKLDLRGTQISAQDYETLKLWFTEAEILWDIPFQGSFYPTDTEELTVSSMTQEDLEQLAYFNNLKRVTAENCPDYPILHRLRLKNPDIQVSYTIPAAGADYSYDTKSLVLPGLEAEALIPVLPYFTELETVELTAPMAPFDQIQALMDAVPQVQFSWNLEVAGIPVNQNTETLDLTGIPMTVEEMDAVLPYLLSLTYVDMTDCGISNEDMDALNRRYEDIQIVWTVTLGKRFRIRTDVTHFMPVNHNFYPSGDDLHNLRYCTEIFALDLGHMGVENIDFVAYMPHLKYLLMCETLVRDLTPLTGLTELVYLELFMNEFTDLSPLATLTALEDLNLHYVKGDPEPIAQMTWLKNLWWNNLERYKLTPEQQQMLRDAIPDCNFNFTSGSSTGGGWRELPNYYAQRDIFGVEYMVG